MRTIFSVNGIPNDCMCLIRNDRRFARSVCSCPIINLILVSIWLDDSVAFCLLCYSLPPGESQRMVRSHHVLSEVFPVPIMRTVTLIKWKLTPSCQRPDQPVNSSSLSNFPELSSICICWRNPDWNAGFYANLTLQLTLTTETSTN